MKKDTLTPLMFSSAELCVLCTIEPLRVSFSITLTCAARAGIAFALNEPLRVSSALPYRAPHNQASLKMPC